MTAEDRRLLEAVLDELRALRAALDAAKLLGAIAARVGDRVFTTDDLLRHAAIDPALGQVLDGIGARGLGGVLRHVRAHPDPNYIVESLGREAAGMLWRVQRR